jgi:hypothetical protein
MQKVGAEELRKVQEFNFYGIKDMADIYGDGEIGPLQSYCQIGEYNTLMKGEEEIYIFNEDDGDDKCKLTRDDLLKNVPYSLILESYGGDNTEASKFFKKCGIEYDTKNKTFTEVAKNQAQFIVMRPWMKYQMESLIAVKAGASTGEMMVGPLNVTVSENGAIKTVYHYVTYYSGAVVHNDDQILIYDNVFYDRCLGGCNGKFFTSAEIITLRDKYLYQWDRVPPNDPLFTKSIIVWPLLLGDKRENIKKVIDATGKFTFESGNGDDADVDRHYGTCKQFCNAFATEVIDQVATGLGFQRRIPATNTVMWKGYQIAMKGTTPDLTPNMGHHGPMIYPGAEKVRRGADTEYRQIQYTSQMNVTGQLLPTA